MDKLLQKDIVEKNKALFWEERNIDELSTDLVVEKILEYGDFDDVRRLINILGIDEIAKIFDDKIHSKRHNFSPQTLNYFKLFFERHSHRNIK